MWTERNLFFNNSEANVKLYEPWNEYKMNNGWNSTIVFAVKTNRFDVSMRLQFNCSNAAFISTVKPNTLKPRPTRHHCIPIWLHHFCTLLSEVWVSGPFSNSFDFSVQVSVSVSTSIHVNQPCYLYHFTHLFHWRHILGSDYIHNSEDTLYYLTVPPPFLAIASRICLSSSAMILSSVV